MIRLLLSALVFVTACGPREAGPHPGERVLWEITQADTTYAQCSDEPAFREKLPSFGGTVGSYVAYEVAQDGKTARTLKCERMDPSWCQDDPAAFVFTVAGDTLLYSETVVKDAFYYDSSSGEQTISECKLEQTAAIAIVDQGTTMTFNVDFLHALTGSQTECPQIQQQFVEASKNGEGVDGCAAETKLLGRLPEGQ